MKHIIADNYGVYIDDKYKTGVFSLSIAKKMMKRFGEHTDIIAKIKANPKIGFGVAAVIALVAFMYAMPEEEEEEYSDEEDEEEQEDGDGNESKHKTLNDNNIVVHLKQRLHAFTKNLKLRYLFFSVPVMCATMYIFLRYQVLGSFSAVLAGTAGPKEDIILTRYITPDIKTYDDTQQCLRKTDPELHSSFKSVSSLANAYFVVLKTQHQRSRSIWNRSVLTSHLIRSDGTLRDTVAEIAIAIQKHYKMTNVIGRLNTKRKYLFGTRKSYGGQSHMVNDSNGTKKKVYNQYANI